jgi:hypothetical protein
MGYKQMNRVLDYVDQIWELMSPERANVVAGGIEKQIETTVEGRSLRGRIDLVMSGKEDRPILVDFKTGSQVEFPEGELYPNVVSRNVNHLPILSLATDDDFFQLRTYDYILGEVELSQKSERQLALIHLAQTKLRIIDVGDRDRGGHGDTLTNLIAELGTAEKSRLWQARHGHHCGNCPVRYICPLSLGDEIEVLPPANELERRYLPPGETREGSSESGGARL